MDLTYLIAEKIASECKHLDNLICAEGDTYRDCDRPLCCGACPSVDQCPSVCSPIIDGLAAMTK